MFKKLDGVQLAEAVKALAKLLLNTGPIELVCIERDGPGGSCADQLKYSFLAPVLKAIHTGKKLKNGKHYNLRAFLHAQAKEYLDKFPEIYHAGFLADAQKEYAEALFVRAFLMDRELPKPGENGLEIAAYLKGMGEAASELRRYILDSLRRDDISRCEEFLETMDAAYSLLVSLDFPDAITGGLRRTADQVRGVLERTRGDLTMALRQRELTERLSGWADKDD